MSEGPCSCDIKASLQRIEDRLDTLSIQGAENKVVLQEHIRRTELLEEALKPMEKDVAKFKLIVYVVLALASSAGLLGSFGKTVLSLFSGAP